MNSPKLSFKGHDLKAESIKLANKSAPRYAILSALLCTLIFSLSATHNSFTSSSSGSWSAASHIPKLIRFPVHDASHLTISRDLPQTYVRAHLIGHTVFENLYVHNGTIYIVTDRPEDVPALARICAGPAKEPWREQQIPNPDIIQMISPDEAVKRFSQVAGRMTGTTFLWHAQFLVHYAHFTLEMLLGTWAVYYKAMNPKGLNKAIAMPTRFQFTIVDENGWRDRPKMNSFILKNAFPEMTYAYRQDWEERKEFGMTTMYDLVVVSDRNAAQDYTLENYMSNNIGGAIHSLHLPDGWWEPVRQSILQSLSPSKFPAPTKPVVTYINRQRAVQRKVNEKDNEELEAALKALEPDYEVNVIQFEFLNRAEQIQMAARSNVLISLHGNGLTHLLWAQPHATVIEMLPKGAFARNFHIPSNALGMRHVATWGDTVVRSEYMPPAFNLTADFNGNNIRAHGPTVVRLVQDALAGNAFPKHMTVIQ